MSGLVVPFAISVFYFRRFLFRPLIGYYVAPFTGLILSLLVATPFLIYKRISTGQVLFNGRETLSGDIILCTLLFSVFVANLGFIWEAKITVNQLLNERIQNIVGSFNRSLQEQLREVLLRTDLNVEVDLSDQREIYTAKDF